MLSVAAAPSGAAPDSLYHEVRPAMGTTVEIFLWAPSLRQASGLFEAAFAEIDYADRTLTTYREDSEVSRINATAAREPVTVDPEVFRLLQLALDYSRRTDGAFDITVGPLVKAWGFFGDSGRMPSRRAIARARARTGWALVALDSARRTVRFRRPGVELDFGAIGKGWALDRAAAALRRLGVAAALLGLGESSYYAIGAPPGRDGWPVNVTDPTDTARVLARVILRDGSLATSGVSQQFFEMSGRRYGHIIDPRSGRPVEGTWQVTVTASTATASDALSTSLFVLGADGASTLLGTEPQCGALFVLDAHGSPRVTAIRWPGALEVDAPGSHT